MKELEDEDPKSYRSFICHDPPFFAEMVRRVGSCIERYENNIRKPTLMITCTLRFLATGNTYDDTALKFCIAQNTISLLVKEVGKCWIECKGNLFYKTWNFHNTIGACDGKHVAIRKPARGGSMFYNYIIVFLALETQLLTYFG